MFIVNTFRPNQPQIGFMPERPGFREAHKQSQLAQASRSQAAATASTIRAAEAMQRTKAAAIVAEVKYAKPVIDPPMGNFISKGFKKLDAWGDKFIKNTFGQKTADAVNKGGISAVKASVKVAAPIALTVASAGLIKGGLKSPTSTPKTDNTMFKNFLPAAKDIEWGSVISKGFDLVKGHLGKKTSSTPNTSVGTAINQPQRQSDPLFGDGAGFWIKLAALAAGIYFLIKKLK